MMYLQLIMRNVDNEYKKFHKLKCRPLTTSLNLLQHKKMLELSHFCH
jgi:hypothetical protein